MRRQVQGMTNSNQKGKRGELEVVRFLREHGIQARRSQQYCGVAGDSDVKCQHPWHIEVKRVEKLNINKAVHQAVSEAASDRLPIVFHRKNGGSWLVTMQAEDFLNELERVRNTR